MPRKKKNDEIEEETELEEKQEEIPPEEKVTVKVGTHDFKMPKIVYEALLKYRDKQALSEEEKARLFAFLINLPKHIQLSKLCRQLNFSKIRVRTLRNLIQYYRNKLEEIRKAEQSRKQLESLEKRDFAAFVSSQWSELKKIGQDIILNYSKKATDRGMSISEYVTAALEFYDHYADKIDEFNEQMEDLKALVYLFKEAAETNFARLTALRIYTDFTAKILKLRSLGVPVPEEIMNEMKDLTNRVLQQYRLEEA